MISDIILDNAKRMWPWCARWSDEALKAALAKALVCNPEDQEEALRYYLENPDGE